MIIYSADALADLDDIFDFHLTRNPRFAAELNDRLTTAAESLAIHPDRGASISGSARRFRKLVESGHVIVYERSGENIVVVRILHGARDIEAILSQDP